MALIRCPECGKEVSDTISQCIHCGYVLTQKEKQSPKQTPELVEEKTGIEIISFRGGPSYMVFISIFYLLVVLSCGIVSFVFFYNGSFYEDNGLFIALGISFAVISFFFLLIFIMNIIDSILNASIKEPCIEYDHDNDVIIAHTLGKEEIKIHIKYFHNLICGFWSTSRMLKLFYIDEEKGYKAQYLRLGYTSTKAAQSRNRLLELKINYLTKK